LDDDDDGDADEDDDDSDEEKDSEHESDCDVNNDVVVSVHGHDGVGTEQAAAAVRGSSLKGNLDDASTASGRGLVLIRPKKPSPIKFNRKSSSEHMSSSVLNMTPTMSSQLRNRRKNRFWKWGRK
jgi:hypothetical protein